MLLCSCEEIPTQEESELVCISRTVTYEYDVSDSVNLMKRAVDTVCNTYEDM